MAKVDILLATYNGEKYLKEQLDSILNQTFQDFTVIISDDCSKDKTREILSYYEKKDKRIKIYYQHRNLGYRKNFEFLCKKSHADYCMFSDQDDVWEKNKIEILLNEIEKGHYSLVHCDLRVTNQKLETLYPSMIRYMNKLKQCQFSDYRAVNLDNVVTGCALIATHEVIQKALPFPGEIYVHDWWVALIATQIGKIHYIDTPLVNYRQHEKNSIGIRSQERRSLDFEQYRSSVIEFHQKQYQICLQRKDKFQENYRTVVEMSNSYFQEIETHNRPFFQKIKLHRKVYKDEPLQRQIKLFLMLYYPNFAKKLYNLRKKRQERGK